MNRETFLQEVLSSGKGPADFAEIYARFNEYQDRAMDTLRELHRVCEKNNISYQLAYGSLLGAIRDGGQIPWDYDIDVFVPYEQKQALIEALRRDLGEDYYFRCPETDAKCRGVAMRLAPKGYRSEVLHVDVFYLTGAPEDPEERKQHVRQIREASWIRFYKLSDIMAEGKGHPKIMLELAVGKLRKMFRSVNAAWSRYQTFCGKYPARSSKICISADVYADWYEFPAEYIWETKLIRTNDGEFRIPVHYDEVLTMIYKDYRKSPSLEQRIYEVLVHHERLERFHKDKK